MNIDEILEIALRLKASDIHITSQANVFVRVDSELIRILPEKIFTTEEILAAFRKLVKSERFNDFEQNKALDCDFIFENLELKVRVRGNIFRFSRGVSMALRLINLEPLSLDTIGAPNVLKEVCEEHNGLVLVTGPTGSGKSTTLAAMIDYINCKFKKHVITIEDPIEYIYNNKNCLIHQRQVKEHVEGFSEALRTALREDPDYILVGELRDLETIRLALTAAETGHLVFATLHTNSAAESIDRIVDIFQASEKELIRSMLASSLRLVVYQRLVKKIEGGRVAAMEIMVCNTAVKNLIRENKVFQIYSAMQMGKSLGMQTMEDSLKSLAAKGIIDFKNTK